MKKFKLASMLLSSVMSLSLLTGCGSSSASNDNVDSNGIKTFTAFYAVPGTELPDDNRVKNAIAEKIGARVDETWLTGQTAKERVGTIIAGGEYPDLIDGGDGMQSLIDAGALIPLDDYIDKYPNIKNYMSKTEWERTRSKDGHIYMLPQFGVLNGNETKCNYNDEAFWIQKAVLKWAGYPKITTLDQYFDLIEKYKAANPTIDGKPTQGFEILCDDWRYFCLENPPQFLAGYPNDGKAIVDKNTHKAINYNTIPEAKQYFKKLSEEYAKGIIDPETFTSSYDQYTSKISSGNVLGMVDQYWQFQNAETALKKQQLYDRTYVPLALTLDPNVKPHYYSKRTLTGSGVGITVSCKDVDGALKCINDLLSDDVITLRNWGQKDVDYEVDENGLFYRNDEQRAQQQDKDWKTANMCDYSYLPHYEGMMHDNKNTVLPADQPAEYYATLYDIDKEVLNAYGYQKYTDFLNKPEEKNDPWYPIYTYVSTLPADSEVGLAVQKMDDVKKKWLPKVVMSDANSFDSTWDEYTSTLNSEVNMKAYEDDLSKEVQRRIDNFSE